MLRLSRTIAYAVHAVLYLARAAPGTPVPCSELAQAGKMPERFLLQILRKLVTHGVLRSSRGVEGGYQLSRPPGEISLLEVVEVLDDPLQAALPDIPGMPPASRCRILQLLKSITQTARAELRKVTFADLVRVETAAAIPTPEPLVDAADLIQKSEVMPSAMP
jgi:Rrf2 family transcriptional regulator, cysteine metabolism repressor